MAFAGVLTELRMDSEMARMDAEMAQFAEIADEDLRAEMELRMEVRQERFMSFEVEMADRMVVAEERFVEHLADMDSGMAEMFVTGMTTVMEQSNFDFRAVFEEGPGSGEGGEGADGGHGASWPRAA